ncbi:MAG: hypothetical protein OES09_07450 [Gammaproteobacteria bacterium]|nr:hypothetical protein [Gammaproteobacteria bacterium]
MIRFINCVKKRSDISIEEFLNYWHNQEFEDLLQQVIKITKPKRYARNLTLDVDANVIVKEERGSLEPYNGIIEYWWDNGSELLDLYATDKAKLVRREMIDYQNRFIDLTGSSAFFTEFQ